MVYVVAENYFKKNDIETVLNLLEVMVTETRKEPGCIQYDLVIDNNDDTHYVFLEQWETQQHLDAHIKTEHFTNIIPKIEAYKLKEAPLTFLNKVY